MQSLMSATSQLFTTSSTASPPPEKAIKSNWAPLLVSSSSPSPSEIRKVAVPGYEQQTHSIFCLENTFSQEECEVLLQASETEGYGFTNYPKSYRGNLRLITTDRGLTELYWARVKDHLPPTVELGGDTWEITGLNRCWRLAKYFPGDKFGRHCDAAYTEGNDLRSMFTVNIYMNEGFQGGSTRFFANLQSDSPSAAIVPNTGLALIFRQPPGASHYHDGQELESDLKYLFRTDVMYRRMP